MNRQFVNGGAGDRKWGGKGGSGICFTPFKECSITHMPVCPGAYLMEWKSIDARVPPTLLFLAHFERLTVFQSVLSEE